MCGPEEEGKDAVFIAPDPLGGTDIVVVQTKKGALNLASRARDNLISVTAQLKTASETRISFVKTKERRLPSKVILCASGKINPAARKHIVEEVGNPHLRFSDSDDLIPQIDENYPELWLDIDAEVLPYMRELRRMIEETSETTVVSELATGGSAAATDHMFVDLYLWRNTIKLKKRKGQVERVPEVIEVPVTGILKKPERLVLILGEAGAGKSTAIRRIAYVLAGRAISLEDPPLVPVLLRAIDLTKNASESLLGTAVTETKRISGSSRPAFKSGDLQGGRVVLLIDALDEIAEEEGRKLVFDKVAGFVSENPKCLVILTSREYAFIRSLAEQTAFVEYRVQQFSYRQAQQLIQKLERKGSLPAESSKELVRRLEEIHGMELNPLLVTVFAATSEYSRQDVPANITELFKKFTEMMLGRWDASKGVGHQYHAPLKDFVLCRVAYDMHQQGDSAIDMNIFRSQVSAELQKRGYDADVEKLLDEILNRSGLLRVVGEKVEFRHFLLQEFFAGRGIPSEEVLDTFVFSDWWRRAIVFYFGERPGSVSALKRIRNVVGLRGSLERFTAAGTLGLALQACYLIPVTDKIEGIVDVMEHFSTIKDDLVNQLQGTMRFPLMGFLAYYLLGRDSVALTALEHVSVGLQEKWQARDMAREDREARVFWLIVGLIESGKVTQAEVLLSQFRPIDSRQLLAIHLGCFLIQHLRVSTTEQKRIASRICDRISPVVGNLRDQLLSEYKTQLLEVRRGNIASIPEKT